MLGALVSAQGSGRVGFSLKWKRLSAHQGLLCTRFGALGRGGGVGVAQLCHLMRAKKRLVQST